MQRFSRFCLTLLVCLLAVGAHAQEQTTVKPTSRDVTNSQNISGAMQNAVNAISTQINQPCAAGGSSYQHNQSWNESCPTGMQGSVTKTCVHGQDVITESTCQAANPCSGGYSHGQTWSANDCGYPMTGQNNYKCLNGEAVVTSSTCQATYQCLNGSTYSSSCPAGTTGSIYYQCSNNTLYQTANYCSRVYNSCGGYPHGSGYYYACANWGGNMTGNVYYQCFDGAWAISSMGCSSSISVWSSSCPYGYTGGYLNFSYAGSTYSNGGCNMVQDGYWTPSSYYGCVNGNGQFICYQNYTCLSPTHGYNNAACASGNPSGHWCATGLSPVCQGSWSW